MKKVLCVLMFLTALVTTSRAAIIAFEAEDERFIYRAGDKWMTVEDETAATALNGKYIEGNVNLPASNATSFRGFSFPVTAGTYNLYARLELEQAGGWYNNDSFYVSNSTFAQAASVSSYVNQIDTKTDVDGVSMSTVGFKWYRVDTDYVMAADGTGYLMISPREDGLRVDAFAYATADETITNAVLNNAVLLSHFIQGAATNPNPTLNAVVDEATVTSLAWQNPTDPNFVSVTTDVVFGTEPNMLLNTTYPNVTSPLNLASKGIYLDYDTTYYWRVDSHIVWDSNEITGHWQDVVKGSEWRFTTLPQDKVPAVAANDFLTAMEFLPDTLTATVDDLGEDDIQSMAWEVLVPAVAKRIINRTADADLAALAQITPDPSLLRDWIGADTRDAQIAANPLKLTLKGLPAGTYSWKSYHHDAQNQNGVFDATIHDASGTVTTTDIRITDANTVPVGTFMTTIVSNGSDVTIEFKLHHWGNVGTAPYYNESFIVMNGFELIKGSDSLKIDFGPVGGDTMTGYQAYTATTQQAETFTQQSYSAFGTTVSILPTWGGVASVTDITSNPSSAMQQATFNVDRPGTYSVQISATDRKQTGSDVMNVTVSENACAAAQLSASWAGFNTADLNKDCLVNLEDLAALAVQWLDTRKLPEQG